MTYPAVSPVSSARSAVPLWNRLFSIALVILAGLYAVVCAIRIFVLNADADMINKIVNAPDSVSRASVDSLSHVEDVFNNTYQVLFWTMYAVFIVWTIMLNAKFRAVGKGRVLNGLLAWKVWRIGLLVSLAIVIFLRAPAAGSAASDFVKFDHESMAFMGVRMAIGILYVWVAISMRRASDPVLAAGPPVTA